MTARRTSRRRFVTGALAAGAAITAPRWALAAGDPAPNANCVAIMADTHVARGHYGPLLAKCLAQVRSVSTRPAHMVVVGDLALGKGQADSYRTFKSVLDRAGLGPIQPHLMLGNHDLHSTFFTVLKSYAAPKASPVPGRQVRLVQTPHCNWFLLDTLPDGDPARVPEGILGAAQLTWLREQLRKHTDRPAVVVGHHNLRLPGMPRNWTCLKETPEVLRLLATTPHVKAYLNGHQHFFLPYRIKDLHIIGLPSTALTFRRGELIGWTLAVARRDGMDLTLRSASSRHRDEGRKVSLKWR